MDCREILKIYQLYVDDEMEQSALKQVKNHINDCPDCQYRIKFEVKFKSTITKKVKSSTRSAPDDLRDKILKNIF